MNRTKGILAAGTLTGLVLITILALGFGNLRADRNADVAAETAVSPVNVPAATTASSAAGAQINEEAVQAVQAWQQYSAELEETVRTMQTREAAYQAQIEAANQTILQLQDSINTANSGASFYDDDDDDRYDDHDNDHDDHDEDDDD